MWVDAETTATLTWHCGQHQTFKIRWNKQQCFLHLNIIIDSSTFNLLCKKKKVISQLAEPTMHLNWRHKCASSIQSKCVCKLATGSYETEACTDRQTEMNSNEFQYCFSSTSICWEWRGDNCLTDWLVSWSGSQCGNGSFSSVIR